MIKSIIEITLVITEKGPSNQAGGIRERFLEEAMWELDFDG